ncbi:nucleotide sugar dehydrogenase [Rhabdothermincola salaria]|uniref:nucleotide sugar dehydrogenase n=1 Tax=Rhabdothermincola salaria TaxID=2903142 RepID=UPI001E40713E|nr:nucleotide sugar dehydrogenase [Rhabdothermincola salaria]
MDQTIAVIGTGYVGLTTGACFSSLGHTVVCVDIDPDKVASLQQGRIPIHEPGLEEIVREGMDAGRLRFTTDVGAATADAQFAYLCVPTPQGADGSADLTYLEAAAEQIAPHLPAEAVVVNKSTVPVGSTRRVEQALGRSDLYVVSNPEFLREGSAVHDFLNPDRVVIGSDDQGAAIRVASLYLGVPAPLMVTDPASAETIKYASNAFLAMKLSFVNAVAALCEALGADADDVMLGMGYDTRIGNKFLRPGPGWGGSCFEGAETVLVRRGWQTSLITFEQLACEVESRGIAGVEVLAWNPGDPAPEFFPVAQLTVRDYDGVVVDIVTKMGRRLTVTADHPMVVGDGVDPERTGLRLADDLTTDDWLPIAQGAPLAPDHFLIHDLTATLGHADLDPSQVICRLSAVQRQRLFEVADELPAGRRRDVLRSGTLRLDELERLGMDVDGALLGTTTNGTYVPALVPDGDELWWMLGIYAAEGHVTRDGSRRRVACSFHPHLEHDLVERVRAYWEGQGVKAEARRVSTTRQVAVSSRVLAAWFESGLGLGSTSYTKRVPDVLWGLPESRQKAFLRGLWDGDGSWSYVNGGPSVCLEYGTVSRELADGMLRLLGGLGIVARLKVGRSAKATTDAYFLTISGADQVEQALFLVPEGEAFEIRAALDRQAKRIAPTGYRRLGKGAVWARVARVESRHHVGPVYSIEVPGPHTVVATGGLVAHNCFPKDTRALRFMATEAGYDFDLLDAVLSINDAQFDRVVAKITQAAGGTVDGVRIGVWGLTFKANTDDRRDSPAVEIVRRLVAAGAEVHAHDPTVTGSLPEVPEVVVCDDVYAPCQGARVLAVLTEWDQFKWVDLDKVADAMTDRHVVDARNLLDRGALLRRGFTHQGIGR